MAKTYTVPVLIIMSFFITIQLNAIDENTALEESTDELLLEQEMSNTNVTDLFGDNSYELSDDFDDFYDSIDLDSLEDIEKMEDLAMSDKARLFFAFLRLEINNAREKAGVKINDLYVYIIQILVRAHHKVKAAQNKAYEHKIECLLALVVASMVTLATIYYVKPSCIFESSAT